LICSRAEILTYLGMTNPSDTELAQLDMLRRTSEAEVKAYIDQEIEQATYTEYLPSSNAKSPNWNEGVGGWERFGNQAIQVPQSDYLLQLTNVPVRTVTSVYQTTLGYSGYGPEPFDASHLLTPGTHYWVDEKQPGISYSGLMGRLNGAWPYVARSVKVTYVAGYSEAELNGTATTGIDVSEIKAAVLMAIKDSFYDMIDRGEITSERILDYGISYQPLGKSSGGSATRRGVAWRAKLQRHRNYGMILGV
jgi:hypothetical protein